MPREDQWEGLLSERAACLLVAENPRCTWSAEVMAFQAKEEAIMWFLGSTRVFSICIILWKHQKSFRYLEREEWGYSVGRFATELEHLVRQIIASQTLFLLVRTASSFEICHKGKGNMSSCTSYFKIINLKSIALRYKDDIKTGFWCFLLTKFNHLVYVWYKNFKYEEKKKL